MMRSVVVFILLGLAAHAAEADLEDLKARLRMALQIARERNDRELVAKVETVGREIQAAPESEAQVREVENAVGIDPGGWSMAGQPLFHPTGQMRARQPDLEVKLATAMRTGDAEIVRGVTQEMLALLGIQAGVPDGRRAGRKAEPRVMNEAEAVKLFVKALKSEGRAVRQLNEGRPLPDQMVRLYADVLTGLTTVRPVAARHVPEAAAELDGLTHGVAAILTRLQRPEGHFPFPDLRGKNIRFGDMIMRQFKAAKAEVKDGWVITPDAAGGTQFDTGLCGTALLLAGKRNANETWMKAGLRAADWALAQECCANFNYNAFSVSLLAHAFRVTGQTRYLDAAMAKFRVGVAPGQAPNGRWMDPHNARTVYHVIILRALGDLGSALPAERRTERAEVEAVAKPAVAALLDEFDAMGMTVEALPELQTLAALQPEDMRLKAAVRAMTSLILCKCTDGTRVKMGSSVVQLAAVALTQD
ncbi:MAG TPA: hypothetical protein VGE39_23090 [Prosthecobacter sp.]